MNLEHIKIKFRLLFVPYLLVSLGLLLVVVGMRWLFITKLSHLQILDDVYAFYIPIVLTLVVPYLLFRKPMSLIKIKSDKHPYGILMVNTIFLALTLSFLPKAADPFMFPAVEVNHVDEVVDFPSTRHFSVKNYQLDTTEQIVEYTEGYSGVRNPDPTFYGNVCIPFSGTNHKVWLGIKATETLNNATSDRAKNRARSEVRRILEEEMQTQYGQQTQSFEKELYSDDWHRFSECIRKHSQFTSGMKYVILSPQKSRSDTADDMTLWGGMSLVLNLLFSLLITLFAKIDYQKYELLYKPRNTVKFSTSKTDF